MNGRAKELFLLPFVVYAGLKIAPYCSEGLLHGLLFVDSAFQYPFRITFCSDTLPVTSLFLLIYGIVLAIRYMENREHRYGEEHGSARLARIGEIQRLFQDPDRHNNILLTEHTGLSLNCLRHQRNLNVLVCGGSGSGKSRYYVRPNLLQANSNYVVLDPKGELLSSCGSFLESRGYTVRVLNLYEFRSSHMYNPLTYLENEEDVQRLVTNLFASTTPHGSTSKDPFWDESAQMLLMAILLYIHENRDSLRGNFSDVMTLLHMGAEKYGKDTRLDDVFARHAQKKPDSCALKYYNSFSSGTADTKRSIQITLMARLNRLNIPDLQDILFSDELQLPALGSNEKRALFLVIPDNDTSFNFLIGMLYTQLFQILYRIADKEGQLPRHVHFLMDEFANVALPEDFDKLLATMRSRNISVSILLQNMAQLKSLFPHTWESVTGNCDSFLYLGGNEKSTHEYVSELLGEGTIAVRSETVGKHGTTRTQQLLQRRVLRPEEVRLLLSGHALLFIRGSRPLLDRKIVLETMDTYHLASHLRPYTHTLPDLSAGSIILLKESDTHHSAPARGKKTKKSNIQYEQQGLFDEDRNASFDSLMVEINGKEAEKKGT